MMVYSHSFFAMNSRFSMVVPGLKNERGDELAGELKGIVENWEACLSSFRRGAELQLINALAYGQELKVSESMSRVLDVCDRYNRLTGGLFDPAVNCNKSRWEEVIRDQIENTIVFSSPEVKLDMGGIGKGFALEEVVAYLKSEGVNDAFLSFGESSIAGMGKHPHGEGWLIGESGHFMLRDEFVSVSGLQDTHAPGEDRSGAHIFHPLKGELVSTKKTVMVKCDSPLEAEVLSSCAYMADEKEFKDLKLSFPAAEWLFPG